MIERISDSPEFRASLIQEKADEESKAEQELAKARTLQHMAEVALENAQAAISRAGDISRYLKGETWWKQSIL